MTAKRTDRLLESVSIVGAGSIGVGWCIAFARSGMRVAVHDPDADRLHQAVVEISAKLADLASFDLLSEAADAIARRIVPYARLGDALIGSIHVQECAPENLELKRQLFARLDDGAAADVPLASSSSAMSASLIAGDLAGRGRCLVLHPVNPPHLLPVVEVVPAPFTRDDIVARSEALLERIGMSPVRVHAKVEGFVFNRLQWAVLREAYCLVRDGIAHVDDIDRVVRDGLGRRWAVVGPFETSDLNAPGGIGVHAAQMGAAYARRAQSEARRTHGPPGSSSRSPPSAAPSCRLSGGTIVWRGEVRR